MIRKVADKAGYGWLFLFAVVGIYAITGLADPSLLGKAIAGFGDLVLSIVPIVILVFGLLFLSNFILGREKAMKYLGESSGVKGWLISIAGGVLSSGPIYMWYPLLSDLREKGMKDSLIATFLYNRSVKIPLLPMMVYYFGWAFTTVLAVYMILFSVVNGIIVQRFVR